MEERTPFGVKVGDRIKIISSRPHENDGKFATVKRLLTNRIYVSVEGTPYDNWSITEGNDIIERVPKTFTTLLKDDIVLDDDEDEYKVLAVLTEGIYLLSGMNDFDSAGDIVTATELEADTYTIKDQPAAEVKMSVKALEEKLGLSAGSLHVVKE